MPKMLSVAAALSLAGGAAFGQASPAPAQPVHKRHHVSTGVEKPVDKGPYTPEANAAYQGGGVNLAGGTWRTGAPAAGNAARPDPTRRRAELGFQRRYQLAWLGASTCPQDMRAA